MYLVYLGESGNTGASLRDPRQPHQVYVALLVHETQWVSMNGEYTALCKRYFGGNPGENGVPKELHASHIYQGLSHFASWPPKRRQELIQDCLSILLRRETPLLAAFINKREFLIAQAKGDTPETFLWEKPGDFAINRLLFALQMFVDELSMAGMSHEQLLRGDGVPIKDHVLVIADTARSVRPQHLSDFLRSEGDASSALLENFSFVPSEHAPLIQLSDMCAYFVRRWLQDPSGSHPYFDALRKGSVLQVMYPVRMHQEGPPSPPLESNPDPRS